MIFDEESASDAQKFLAPPKRRILEKKSTPTFLQKKYPPKNLDVEKWNVGNYLKRVFPKFHADRSEVRGVNGRSKFRKNVRIRERGGTPAEPKPLLQIADTQALMAAL